ncbi:MAG: sensor histidine kinase [Acidobacteriota bacterium]|nr:sensor histidine kinase [Acidobacteriota bacterium]
MNYIKVSFVDSDWRIGQATVQDTVGDPGKRSIFGVDNLVTGAYILIGFLLISAVLLSVRFRDAARWRMSPQYVALEERDQQLAKIRKSVSQGVTATRDYLINNRPSAAEIYDQDLRRAKANASKAFLSLNGWTSRQDTLSELDHELADYWRLLDQERLNSAKQKSEQGFDFLHSRLFPVRNDIVQSLKSLTDRVSQEREAIGAQFARDRSLDLTAIFLIMGVALAISLFLASGNQSFRRDLQVESRRKFEEVARARDDLEQLSGKLLKVQEDERRRLSRELHDGIGQTLTALRMEIHQVQILSAAAGFGEERLARARGLAEEALKTVKNISLLLRPPLLDDLGLEPALAWQTDQFTRRTGIPCRFRAIHLQELLPEDMKSCVFRVIQEALNNCEKHASPSMVAVTVEQNPETLVICVEDDGAGFALNDQNGPARRSGLGILGMRERAVMLGGHLTIRSAPGKGTKLMLSVPIAKIEGDPEPARLVASSPVLL